MTLFKSLKESLSIGGAVKFIQEKTSFRQSGRLETLSQLQTAGTFIIDKKGIHSTLFQEGIGVERIDGVITRIFVHKPKTK